ncbi:MAG: hypothetical protein PVI01_04765 [Gemmatimonadales bacterium]|jgi:hypothetical protein
MRTAARVVGVATLPALLLWSVPGQTQSKLTQDDAVFMVREATEYLIEDFLAGNWVSADAQVDSIESRQNDVYRAMDIAGSPPGTRDLFGYLLFRLRDYTWNRVEPVQAALAANQMAAQLIDLDRAKVTAPQLATARMDYLAREVLLLSKLDDDHGLSARRIAELTSTWGAVAPAIVEAGEAELADRMDDRLDRLREDVPKARLEQVADEILDLVDELEGVVR